MRGRKCETSTSEMQMLIRTTGYGERATAASGGIDLVAKGSLFKCKHLKCKSYTEVVCWVLGLAV